jgi:hypothetical protein
MTKKAAKKKEVGKKTAAKSSRARTEKGEGSEEAKSSPEAASGPAAERPVQEIKVVEETAPREVSDPPRKMGRVPRPDGGKRPERTEPSRQQRSGSARRSGGRRGSGGGGGGSHRPTVDSEELGRKAWKVFQHEIAEEGLALIDETSARQLAEKSLVVTRAFLEERERRLGKSNASEERSPEPLASEEAPAIEETAAAAVAAPAQESPAAEDSTPAAEA